MNIFSKFLNKARNWMNKGETIFETKYLNKKISRLLSNKCFFKIKKKKRDGNNKGKLKSIKNSNKMKSLFNYIKIKLCKKSALILKESNLFKNNTIRWRKWEKNSKEKLKKKKKLFNNLSLLLNKKKLLTWITLLASLELVKYIVKI